MRIKLCNLLLTGTLVATLLAAILPVQAAGLPAVQASKSLLPVERLVDGQVQAVNQATVSAETSGRVQEILYDIGDKVPAGAVILKLVSTEQRENYNQAAASLDDAEANFSVQEQEFRRIEDIYNRKLVAKSDYDRAAGNFASAKARVESARSAVKAAKERLSYTLVKAPFGGTVYARHIELGEAVQPGKPLMSGFDPDALRVEADLPQAVAGSLGKLGKVRVLDGDNSSIEPQKVHIFPQADQATGTVHVRLDLPKKQSVLRPGQYVKIAIVTGEAERLLVPVTSIIYRSEVAAVYVQTGDEKKGSGWQFRQVRLGTTFGDRQEVLSGLAEGEKVAVDAVAAGIAVAKRIENANGKATEKGKAGGHE